MLIYTLNERRQICKLKMGRYSPGLEGWGHLSTMSQPCTPNEVEWGFSPLLLPFPPRITHISLKSEAQRCAWRSFSCSPFLASDTSVCRDLARRGGPGQHPACGTISLSPSASGRRVEWVLLVGNVEVSPRGKFGQNNSHCFMHSCFKDRVCESV